MGSILKFLSAMLKGINIQVIAIITILALLGAGTLMYRSALSNNQALILQNTELSNSLKITRNNYDQAVNERDDIAEKFKNSTAMLNAYQGLLGDSQFVLEAVRAKMEKDKKREATVAKKPGLVTRQTQKSYNSLEDQFSCVSGDMESCARLQSSSQPAPKKK